MLKLRSWCFIKPTNGPDVAVKVIVYVCVFAASATMYLDNLPWGIPHLLWRSVNDYKIRIRLYKLATTAILSVMSIVFAKRRLGMCFNVS